MTFDDWLKHIDVQWEGVVKSSSVGKGDRAKHTSLLWPTAGVSSIPEKRERHVVVRLSWVTGVTADRNEMNFFVYLRINYQLFKKKTEQHMMVPKITNFLLFVCGKCTNCCITWNVRRKCWTQTAVKSVACKRRRVAVVVKFHFCLYPISVSPFFRLLARDVVTFDCSLTFSKFTWPLTIDLNT